MYVTIQQSPWQTFRNDWYMTSYLIKIKIVGWSSLEPIFVHHLDLSRIWDPVYLDMLEFDSVYPDPIFVYSGLNVLTDSVIINGSTEICPGVKSVAYW